MPIPTVPISGILEQTPDPFQSTYKFRIARNNRRGRQELATSRDGGATFQVLLPEPTSKTKVGSTPTVQEDGSVEWQAPAAAPTPTSVPYAYADLHCFGTIATGDVFGFFSAPAAQALRCVGVQVSIQTPPVGASVRVDFVSLAGVEQSKVTSLPAGESYVQNLFPSALKMPAGSAWRLKIKQVGSSTAGEFLSVRLILSPA